MFCALAILSIFLRNVCHDFFIHSRHRRLAQAQACALQFDGRIPADFALADFDAANDIFNPESVFGEGMSSGTCHSNCVSGNHGSLTPCRPLLQPAHPAPRNRSLTRTPTLTHIHSPHPSNNPDRRRHPPPRTNHLRRLHLRPRRPSNHLPPRRTHPHLQHRHRPLHHRPQDPALQPVIGPRPPAEHLSRVSARSSLRAPTFRRTSLC